MSAKTQHAELFFSFRSPYSYLAVGRYRVLAERFHLAIRVRTVMPLAVRDPQFFARGNALMMPYVLADAERMAEYLGLPYAFPQPDPIVQDLQTRAIAAEQPHIWRISRLGEAAERMGAGLAFADEAAHLIWGGAVGWNEGDHLMHAARRAGLDWQALEDEVARDPAGLDQQIEENHRALAAAGHWGVPTLVFGGEPFFGQDRIEVALWRMKQAGLQER